MKLKPGLGPSMPSSQQWIGLVLQLKRGQQTLTTSAVSKSMNTLLELKFSEDVQQHIHSTVDVFQHRYRNTSTQHATVRTWK